MRSTIYLLFALFVLVFLLFCGCGKESTEPEPTPEVSNPSGSALIDIPDCISNPDSIAKYARRTVDADSVTGAVIYENVREYIGVADFCASLVAELMDDLSGITTYFKGEFEGEDGDTYKVSFETAGITIGGTTYDYSLNLWNSDDEKLLEFYFNRDPDTKGILIFRPGMIDPDTTFPEEADFFVQILFDLTLPEYDKWMEVSVSGIPAEEKIDNLKLEVYLVGDKVSLRGNSNHPSVSLTGEPEETPVDRNYIFRAMADTTTQLGICEVAVPTSDLTTTENLFETYSITAVFDSLLNLCYPEIPDSLIDLWLQTFEAPGFFTADGFLQPGPDIPEEPAGFEELLGYAELECYPPIEVRDLEIEFIDDSPPDF